MQFKKKSLDSARGGAPTGADSSIGSSNCRPSGSLVVGGGWRFGALIVIIIIIIKKIKRNNNITNSNSAASESSDRIRRAEFCLISFKVFLKNFLALFRPAGDML